MKTFLPKIFCLLFFNVLVFTNSFGQNQKYHRISAPIQREKLEILMKNGLDIDHFSYENNLVFTAEVSDEDIAIFNKYKVKFVYLIKDLEKNLAKYNLEIDKKFIKEGGAKNAKTAVTTPANFTLGTFGGHYTFVEMQAVLDQMRALYPNLISAKSSIGNSVQGRPLYMVKISDNPDVDEAEPEMFFNALHHSREPIGMGQMIYFMWHILENYNTDPDIKTLINSTEFYIVPCVNPDGYVYNQTTNPNGGGMWRKNRKLNSGGSYGVDLNRNYGYQFGYDNIGSSPTQSSETYRGPSAFSEPETQITRDFCNSHNFTFSFDFHSYGNKLLFPFSETQTNTNPELALFNQISTFLKAENNFPSGNTWQTLGYVTNGGAYGWRYGEQTTKPKIYAFNAEVGADSDGFWPASSRIIPLSNTMVAMNLNAYKLATFFGKATFNGSTSISTTSGNIAYSLKNHSLKPATYTVSISSISPYVISTGAAKVYSAIPLLGSQQDNIVYTLDPATPSGTVIPFELTVNNGLSPQTTTVNVTYTCASPGTLSTSSITENSAQLNWGAVNGSTNYYISFKENSSSTWGADILVNGATNYALAGLTLGTSYNWKVKTENCSSYSNPITFQTLAPCNAPISLASTSITNTSATVSWAAVLGATNYTVEYKLASAGTWTVANSATTATSINLTTLNANTLYDWQVRSNCPSGSSTYSAGQFTTLATVINYCASKGNNISYMWIDYVGIGNINRTSGADAGYFNGTAQSTNLVRGSSQTITFSTGYTSTIYRQYWRVWIDFNNNGVFTDAGEQVVNTNASTAGNLTATFTVPAGATLGATRLRISSKNGSSPTSCQTFTYGEVEDYTVNIVAAASGRIGIAEDKSEIVGENLPSEISVFPNPVKDRVTIRINKVAKNDLRIRLFNVNGKLISNQEVEKNTNEWVFDTKNISSGLYMIQVLENNQKPKTIKFLKE